MKELSTGGKPLKCRLLSNRETLKYSSYKRNVISTEYIYNKYKDPFKIWFRINPYPVRKSTIYRMKRLI